MNVLRDLEFLSLQIEGGSNDGNQGAEDVTQVPSPEVDLRGYMQRAFNLYDLESPATARANLGLGSLATLNSVPEASLTDDSITDAKLTDSGVSAGVYGSSVAIPIITVNVKGRITALSTASLSLVAGGDLSGTLAAATVEKIQGRPFSATTPVTGDIAVYNGSTWTPGQIVSTRGAILTRDGSAIVQLVAGSLGSVLSSDGTDPSWTSNLAAGTTGAGGGTLKIHFAAGKYVEVATTGVVTVYHSATAQVSISATAKVTLTYANFNKVIFDTADFLSQTSKIVKIREIDFCESGVASKRLVMCSESYTP